MEYDVSPCRLYVGTEDGAFALDVTGGEAADVGRGLAARGAAAATLEEVGHADLQETVREFAVDPRDPSVAYAACGLRGHGLYRTTDGGDSFGSVGFADAWVWGVTLDPTDPDRVYAGTEPPMLHRSDDGGETWTDFPALDDVPSRDRWTFFYEPFHAGHVHGVSVAPDDPDRVYAAVEHGAFVYTHDGGETWHDALVGSDAHDTLALGDGRVLASAGGGLHASDDGGGTWASLDRFGGLYVKELVRNPTDPDAVYVDATRGSASTDASVHVSRDRGETWTLLADVPPASVTGCNTLAIHPDGDAIFHATHRDEESRVVVTTDEGETWTEIGPAFGTIRAITVCPLP